MRGSGSWLLGGLIALSVATLVAPDASAQVRMRNTETQLLREATNAESEGDLDRAEAVLRQLLQENPRSSGGLHQLERILRAKGETSELLPLIERDRKSVV